MRPSRLPRCTSLALALLLATPAVAVAQPTAGSASDAGAAGDADVTDDAALTRYRDAVDRGTAAFRDGRYAEARSHLERAYALHPEPVLLFNIASSWRRGGNPRAAITAYRRFLAVAPPGDLRQPLAVETIRDLEAELATPTSSGVDAPPSPRLDQRRRGPLAPPRRSRLRPIGLGVVTVGVAGLIAGGVEAWIAHRNERELERLAPGSAWGTAEANLYAEGKRASTWAVLLGASSAALTVTGVTLYLVGRRSDRKLELDAGPTTSGFRVALNGTF